MLILRNINCGACMKTNMSSLLISEFEDHLYKSTVISVILRFTIVQTLFFFVNIWNLCMPYMLKTSLVYFIPIDILRVPVSSNFCTPVLLFVNGPKIPPNNGILLKGVLVPNWLNNPEVSCSLMNLDFLLPHTGHLGYNLIFPFMVFETLVSLVSVSFLQLKKYDNIVFTISVDFILQSCTSVFSFRFSLSFCPILLPCSINLSRTILLSFYPFALMLFLVWNNFVLHWVYQWSRYYFFYNI